MVGFMFIFYTRQLSDWAWPMSTKILNKLLSLIGFEGKRTKVSKTSIEATIWYFRIFGIVVVIMSIKLFLIILR
jgi:hypothetical protein